MKRAQSAIEFLTTYGWAIMVVLLSLGALTYFGVMDMFVEQPNRCELWPEFSCEESQVTRDGEIRLMIRNNIPTLSSINITLETDDCTLTTNEYTQGITPNTAIVNGSFITFICQESFQRGDVLEADIFVQYVERDRTITHTVKGFLRRGVD